MTNAVIFGASGGIGRALTEQLVASGQYEKVFVASRSGAEIRGAIAFKADILRETDLSDAATEIKAAGPLSLCIIAAGLLSDGETLQPEKSHRHQSLDAFERVFRVNTFGPGLVAKHMLPIMPRKGRAVFAALSARVGSISDNRMGGWHAYRASKAALNMLIKNYAIEQARRSDQFIAVSLHPGTVDTALSQSFQGNVPDKQLFTPCQSANYLLDVIANLEPKDSGKAFDWAGKEIPA